MPIILSSLFQFSIDFCCKNKCISRFVRVIFFCLFNFSSVLISFFFFFGFHSFYKFKAFSSHSTVQFWLDISWLCPFRSVPFQSNLYFYLYLSTPESSRERLWKMHLNSESRESISFCCQFSCYSTIGESKENINTVFCLQFDKSILVMMMTILYAFSWVEKSKPNSIRFSIIKILERILFVPGRFFIIFQWCVSNFHTNSNG